MFNGQSRWMVRQKKEWTEILVDWETRNQYEVLSDKKQPLGMVVEASSGLMDTLGRLVLRSHRSLKAAVLDRSSQVLLTLIRPFFFFFSTLTVVSGAGRTLGRVERRFGILFKKYDLHDAQDRVFATIRSPLWRLWTFPLHAADGRELGVISKRWGGGLREIFADADAFVIDLSAANFTDDQKAVAFAAAISIDFDFFEDNANRGVFGLLGGGD